MTRQHPLAAPTAEAGTHRGPGHAVIWLDHHEARMITFGADDASEVVIHPADPPHHLHAHSGSPAGTHIRDEPEFYARIAKACEPGLKILLAGPSTAKHEFVAHLKKHAPRVLASIAVIQTMARVTDPQLLAAGRLVFALKDRLEPRT